MAFSDTNSLFLLLSTVRFHQCLARGWLHFQEKDNIVQQCGKARRGISLGCRRILSPIYLFSYCSLLRWRLLLTGQRGGGVSSLRCEIRGDMVEVTEAWVCSWKQWDIQKITAPLCEKLILSMNVGEMFSHQSYLLRIYRALLSSRACFIHRSVLLSCKLNAAFSHLHYYFPRCSMNCEFFCSCNWCVH